MRDERKEEKRWKGRVFGGMESDRRRMSTVKGIGRECSKCSLISKVVPISRTEILQ
jgi:hypothetical protein